MIILYLIAILCSLVMFAPNVVPNFVKWPIALLVVLLVVFLFNLLKRDSIYSTHDTKKRLHDYGLFNPLIMYVSASIYVLGFTLVATHLKENNVTDIIGQYNDILALIKPEMDNSLFWGLIMIVASVIIYYIRNGFKNNAAESSLKFRSFWYTVFTVVALIIGLFTFVKYSTFDIYDYTKTGYNLYVYLGIAGIVVFVELFIKFIALCVKNAKAKKLANANKPIVVKPIKMSKKATFLGTFAKLVLAAGFFVGVMYLLDTYYPYYAAIANLTPLYFAIGLGASLYVLHLADLLRIGIFCRSCKMKRSRFLLFIFDLLVLVGLAGLLTASLIVVISIFGIYEVVIATLTIRLLYIAIALLVILYLIVIITVASKARHRYLAAVSGVLIFDDFVKEKKIKHSKKESVSKMKKYKKPSFLRVFVQLILAAAVYAGALFGMKYFLPEFDFFGSYLGYVLAVVLVFSIVLNIFTRGIVYRASQGKTSKFLIFVHSLLLLIYLAFTVYASYHYLKDSLFKDNMYYLYILAGVVGLVYLINVIVLGSRSAKIRRQALALAETPVEVVETTIEPVVESPVNDEVLPVEETPSTKKEIKVAKKEAKKAAKLAKKNDKKAKVIAKERKLIEKKLGKKEAKINKKIAKVEKQIAKKLAKLEKKQANN